MYQQITIVGNLGRDPEMKYTSTGSAVTEFSVAVNERRKKGDNWVDETTWFRVSCWGRLAETTNQYLSKGRQVMVVGTVKVNPYIANDGNARATLEVNAREVKFLQGGGAASSGDGYSDDSSAYSDSGDGSSYPTQTEDIPF